MTLQKHTTKIKQNIFENIMIDKTVFNTSKHFLNVFNIFMFTN